MLRPPSLPEHQVVELLRRAEPARGADGELGRRRPRCGRDGRSTFCGGERARCTSSGVTVGGELARVQPQPHRVALLAEDAHRGHAGDGLHALRTTRSAKSVTLEDAAACRCAASMKMIGLGVGVRLLDDRRIGVGRQLAHGAATPCRARRWRRPRGRRRGRTRPDAGCGRRCEVEEITRMPATPLMACSSGSVICESITSALAPG